MGNFYTSLTVRCSDHDSVVKAMKGRNAVVSPTVSGYTTVWDEESDKQDEKIIDQLGRQLSSLLASPVIAVLNHDDDILWYALYSAQGKVDEYNSAPGYFEGVDAPPRGGDAQLLVKTIAPGAPTDIIERVLQNTEYVFAVERHSDLLAALGMPPFAAFGHGYINRGDVPPGLTKGDLTFTG